MEKKTKTLNNVLLFLFLTAFFTIGGYMGITFFFDREDAVTEPIEENDQSGWVENYVHLYGVNFTEKTNMLQFKIENRSNEQIENLENVHLTLSSGSEQVFTHQFKEMFSLEPLGDQEYKTTISGLEEGKTYQLEVFLDYKGQTYALGTSKFNIDPIQ